MSMGVVRHPGGLPPETHCAAHAAAHAAGPGGAIATWFVWFGVWGGGVNGGFALFTEVYLSLL